MIIERKIYLDKLISKRENGLIKVITGIRRCGKSFLLFELYHEYLVSTGVLEDNIVELALDEISYAKYRNPMELDQYIRAAVSDKKQKYYVFIDEIQKVSEIQNPYVDDKEAKIGFVDVLLGLMKLKNVDLYVTGSNSKMLSSDLLTEFRGRGDEIRMSPLTFAEFYSAYEGDKRNAWREYYTYGGMPFVLSLKTHEERSKYLKDLFSKTYISDVLEHNKIENNQDVLEELLNIVSSAIGSLTNPNKLCNTFRSIRQVRVAPATISKYLDYFIDAFLRQQEENHIMENVIYNELFVRDFDIDVGVVEYNYRDEDKKSRRVQLEVDFVANKGSKRYYVQSALSVEDESKRLQEINSLVRVSDSFKKIVVVRDNIMPWHDENGILYIGIEDFLLDPESLEK